MPLRDCSALDGVNSNKKKVQHEKETCTEFKMYAEYSF